jgi:hypothetical protein
MTNVKVILQRLVVSNFRRDRFVMSAQRGVRHAFRFSASKLWPLSLGKWP